MIFSYIVDIYPGMQSLDWNLEVPIIRSFASMQHQCRLINHDSIPPCDGVDQTCFSV
jgi:hypothetical protein